MKHTEIYLKNTQIFIFITSLLYNNFYKINLENYFVIFTY